MIDMTNKRAAIFGLPGSGKSKLVEHIASSTSRHLIYDPMNEHPKFHRFVPSDRNSTAELSEFINKGVLAWRPKLFILEEANRHVRPKPTPLPPGLDDLNDYSRHWDIAWLAVARRMSQFHSDIVELCHYLFIFRLPGKNDYTYMESLHQGLGDTVRALPQYHFAILEDGVKITTHAPVEIYQ